MKILMLNYEFPPLGGGASPASYEIARQYVKRGHSVDVVTMAYQGLKAFEVKDGIHIYRIKCLRNRKEICHPWEQYTFIRSAKKFLRSRFKNKAVMDYDINHTHFIIPTGVLALWLKRRYQLPYIITSHGSDVPNYNPDRFKLLHKFTRPTLRAICKNAESVTSPSRYLADLIKKEIGDYRPVIIPYGIQVDKFQPKAKKKIILSTGRLLPRKGFQHLIRAVAGRDMGYAVHICGDGPMMNELMNLAKLSKTQVVFHGWIDNNSNQYKDLLESASIFVLVSERENLSISLLEAMSAGCAVITSTVSGCPETVEKDGIMIEPKNAEQLKDAITHLISHPNKIEELGQGARQRVIKYYDERNIVKQYERALGLARKRKAGAAAQDL